MRLVLSTKRGVDTSTAQQTLKCLYKGLNRVVTISRWSQKHIALLNPGPTENSRQNIHSRDRGGSEELLLAQVQLLVQLVVQLVSNLLHDLLQH